MDLSFTPEQEAIREAVGRVCEQFDDEYWRRTDETGEFPEAFVAAMAEAGWLGAAMPVWPRPSPTRPRRSRRRRCRAGWTPPWQR